MEAAAETPRKGCREESGFPAATGREDNRLTARALRSHQIELLAVFRATAAGEAAGVRDILAAVAPGGGKSIPPVLAAQALIGAGRRDRICWAVPRDSLRLQAEEAFADPAWRAALGHGLAVRAADDTPDDPCRGLAGGGWRGACWRSWQPLRA